MRYTVKNADGELTFDSITHLRQMYTQGLVAPEDQVRAEDSQVWRKAEAIPELRAFAAERSSEAAWGRWGLMVVACLSASLFALFRWHSLVAAMVLMLPVIVMSQKAVTQVFSKRRG